MVEIVSWIGVAVIALFAVVGFTGVVVTTFLTAVRSLRHRAVTVEAADAPRYASAA
jgi:uncharacterized iron-regulated membrane protein